MNRRALLKRVGSLGLLPLLVRALGGSASGSVGGKGTPLRRVRPSDAAWPRKAQWEALSQQVGGRLVRVEFPLAICQDASQAEACSAVFRELKNPYFIGDQAGLTQSCGWVDAWTTQPSVYAVAAETPQDVAAAVNFAREKRLRLVVKGGGHSYQGTSNAADSLLIWTRKMNGNTLHDAFVGRGCAGKLAPQPAVSVGAGAIWMHTYEAVTTQGGRYVQGGGCATVGVAGLVQGGGFGSFSKRYGMAAAALLEAEVVTADGEVRIANACENPDLFWGLKGGGGGSLGVVTRLTLRTRDLPTFFGVVFANIKARSAPAYRRLVGRLLEFYARSLFNPHWGETVSFRADNSLAIGMLCQGLDEAEPAATWKPFFDWVAAASEDFSMERQPTIASIPARKLWDTQHLRKSRPGIVVADARPGAPEHNVFWASNQGEAGQFLHGYESAWLPASLLKGERLKELADTLFSASRHWTVTLHFNKGLAGSPPEEIDAARETATNPAVLEAFALVIIAAEGPPAYPGVASHAPDLGEGRKAALAIQRAMNVLKKLVPHPGSYLAESNFFERGWQHSFWGGNYQRLQAVKRKYDPTGLFFVHHGVGSEEWSADGFTRRP
jgi:FAD/FMN-containing dehydrogenase